LTDPLPEENLVPLHQAFSQFMYAAGTKPFLLSDVQMDLENSHLPDMASMHY